MKSTICKKYTVRCPSTHLCLLSLANFPSVLFFSLFRTTNPLMFLVFHILFIFFFFPGKLSSTVILFLNLSQPNPNIFLPGKLSSTVILFLNLSQPNPNILLPGKLSSTLILFFNLSAYMVSVVTAWIQSTRLPKSITNHTFYR